MTQFNITMKTILESFFNILVLYSALLIGGQTSYGSEEDRRLVRFAVGTQDIPSIAQWDSPIKAAMIKRQTNSNISDRIQLELNFFSTNLPNLRVLSNY